MYLKILSIRSLRSTLKFQIRKRFHSHHSYIIPSPLPNIDIPNATVPDIIFERCGRFPEKIAVECHVTGRRYTFEEIRRKALNLSQAIIKKFKLRKGDVVAVFLPNVPEFAICALGLLKANLVITTISPLATSDELRRQLNDSGSKVIITTCSLYNTAKMSIPVPNMPILTIKTEKTDATPETAINFQELVDSPANLDVNVYLESSDIALMPFSSGTTGLPKGILYSHRNLTANVLQANAIDEIRVLETTTGNHQDVVPAILPFTHMYGFGGLLMGGLYNLSKLVTVPKFSPDIFVNLFEKHQLTALYTVPATVQFIINSNRVDPKLLQSLRVVTIGSAPLSALAQERFIKMSGKKIYVMQGYGSSECGILTTTRRINSSLGSIGIPVPNTEMKVVGVDNQAPLSEMEKGELWVKGPQVMKGYHNKPEETAKTITDGWFKTGDMVRYDHNKNFYLIDRIKNMIKVKGYVVAPAELQNIIRSYPNILEVIVIGIPHDSYGEVPRAYVTTKPGTVVDTDKLKEFVSKKVSSYKDLKGGVLVMKELPRNNVGKYDHQKLKLQYMEEVGNSHSSYS
ncbi:probable 4-coumarate--CoA ligase 3 [Photinus pyralis]|nr:probable 4-coumarate--CoA ligase 3 [Photinus pyralis]